MVIIETILIHAPVKRVWDTFTDLACWIDWNTVISNVRSESKELAHGHSIKCIFRPFFFPVNVKIRVDEVVPHERIIWTAKKKGLHARHEFAFLKDGNVVRVTSSEMFTGILSTASGIFLPKRTIRSLTKRFLRDLKRASEANPGSG